MDGTPSTAARQLSLWPSGRHPKVEPPPPTHRDVDTSQAAAAQAAPHVPGRRDVLLSIIGGQGPHGATIDELQAATGWLVQSVCPVVNSLQRSGLIRDTGHRRPTRTGSPAKVWTVTDAVGKEALRNA